MPQGAMIPAAIGASVAGSAIQGGLAADAASDQAASAAAAQQRALGVNRNLGQLAIDELNAARQFGRDDLLGSGLEARQLLGINQALGLGQLGAVQQGLSGLGAEDPRLTALASQNPFANFQADPGFQFRQQQGERAINRAAAARGGRLSGRTLQDLAQFNQGLASQEFGNFANRALQQRQQNFGILSDLARQQQAAQQFGLSSRLGLLGQGLGANTALANLALQEGQNLANLEQGLAGGIASTLRGVGTTATPALSQPIPAGGGQLAAANAIGQIANNIGFLGMSGAFGGGAPAAPAEVFQL